MPGLVEGHSHAWEGGVWAFAYAGYFARRDPEGREWPGCDSIAAVVARLREAERALPAGDAPLFAWGFDPIYFGEARATVADLDQVSATRPVVLLHSNGHVLNVNTPVLERTGLATANIEAWSATPAAPPRASCARWRRSTWSTAPWGTRSTG
jgi:predicted amidohydrolase YtcJ